MRLTDLEPYFLKRESDILYQMVDKIAEAEGIRFLCPKCFLANKGSVGTHAVICWNPSIPQTTSPKGGRWSLVGTGYHDLSLVAGSSSILLPPPCNWHGFIKDGEVTL